MNKRTRTWGMLVAGIVLIILAQTALLVALGEKGIGVPSGTRKVLCVGIIGNTTNAARDNAVVIEECANVGILRSSYPPTDITP